MRRAVLAALLFSCSVAAPAAHAQAPVPSVAGGKVGLSLIGFDEEAETHIVLGNDGTTGSATIRFVDSSDGSNIDVRLAGQAEWSKTVTVELGGHAPTHVHLHVRVGSGARDGHVIVQPPGAKAATVPFSTERKPRTWWLLLTAVAALVAIAVIGDAWRHRDKNDVKLKNPLVVGSKWSFKDSWLANVTAVTGVLATVLGATSLLNDVLHGVAVTRLVGLNLLFGALVLAAPLVFATSAARPVGPDETAAGTVGGFLGATTLTLTAAFGQLTVLGLMLVMAGGGWGALPLWVLLGAATVLVGYYAWRSVRGVAAKPVDIKGNLIVDAVGDPAPRRRVAAMI